MPGCALIPTITLSDFIPSFFSDWKPSDKFHGMSMGLLSVSRKLTSFGVNDDEPFFKKSGISLISIVSLMLASVWNTPDTFFTNTFPGEVYSKPIATDDT